VLDLTLATSRMSETMTPPMAGIRAMASDSGRPLPKALSAEVRKPPYVYVSMTLMSVLKLMMLRPVSNPTSAACRREQVHGSSQSMKATSPSGGLGSEAATTVALRSTGP
jgi:hypothetical protein